MAKQIINTIFSRRTLALLLTLVMFFSMFQVAAHAAPAASNNWSYAYYLGQEYLKNDAGAEIKGDPVGYGFQGIITSITFTDDAGKEWTFNWSAEANGEWRITGSRVSKATAAAWPQITDGKTYTGYCGNTVYLFTLGNEGSSDRWTYTDDSSRHANWFRYIRFIRAYTVNVFYENATGDVLYNGIRYTAEAPLTRYFTFLYPNGGIIDGSEYEDGEYTEPTTLLPADYLPAEKIDQGYEIKYATDADGKDVLATGVTISLLGENVLNVYCTLVPPETEDYTIIHKYYTEGGFDGEQSGGAIEVEANADFAEVVDSITKAESYNGNTYTYVSYTVDPANKVIVLTYTRQIPRYDYSLIYNANFGADPDTKVDSESVSSSTAVSLTVGVDANEFVRENHTFIGWNTEPNGSGTAHAAGQTVTLTAEANTEVLYAQWEENPKYDYEVIYSANFGTDPETKADGQNVTGTYAVSYTVGVDSNSFDRANYTFIGWATEPNGEVVYQAGDEIHFNQGGSQVLYAKWIEHDKYAYTVIYNGNGGALAGGELAYGDGENVDKTYATSHKVTVDANTFLRENYTFIGWNTEADGSGTAYTAEDVISLTAADNAKTLYAQWTENPKYDYAVTYNANFGETPEIKADGENATGVYAETYEIGVDENSFIRENYTFTGWNTAADGSGTAYAAEAVIALTAEGNTEVLYAQWVENPKYDYTLHYNANFGASPETKADTENVSGVYAESYNISADINEFTRANYTFVGWNTASDGSGTAYTPGQTVALTAADNTEVLYAQWAENPKYAYSLIYNANFGTSPETKSDSENISGVYATGYSIGVDENTFVRENYTFAGWNTASDGSGTAYAPGESVALTSKDNKAVLYAQWIENPKYAYSLTYSANFGETPETKADGENISGTYAESYSITVDENTFVRENYTFTGWNTTADGSGTDYSAGQAVALTAQNNTEVLYAQWTENPKYDYSLIYNANFGTSPETKADAENVSGTYSTAYTLGVDANTFVRENYTFIGWNTEADGSGTAYNFADTVALNASDNTEILYAQWAENPKYDYEVIYNANFGLFPAAAEDAQNVEDTYAAAYTIEVDANGFERKNYTFIGWATEPRGEVVYQAGDQIHFAQGGSQTLYAQWIEHDKYAYTVIYNGNGGALAGGELAYGDAENIAETYAVSHNVGVDANTFVRENYTFVGWNTKADGSGTAYAAQDVIALTAAKNTETLYAQWIENDKYDYSLVYSANFGTAPETKADAENISGTYDTVYAIGVDENGFQRSNYTFIGWNTEADGSGTAYAAGQTVVLTAAKNSKILYAQWSENPKHDYAVTYNANFGLTPETKADAENVSDVYAIAYTIGVDANGFQRSHYTFIGWNTKADGSGTAYAAGQSIDLTAENNTQVLYAQWAEHAKYDYSLIYDANFGQNPATKADSENVTGVYDTAYAIGVDANEFVRENYTFAGWNTEADGSGKAYLPGQRAALTAQVNSEILYAQWIENPKYDYEVTYNANFGLFPATAKDAQNVKGTYAVEYTIGVDTNGFTRKNYTFIGWATEPEGEVVYQAGDQIRFLQGGSEVLYAKWIEHDKYAYTVIYNGNGGALAGGELAYGDAENVVEVYETSHSVAVDENTFVRANYTFAGWNTDPNGTGKAYTAQEIMALTAKDNTLTLYAQWVEHPKYDYTVIYNANVGADSPTKADSENVAQTYAAAHNIGVDSNSFLRANYTFVGWNTAADGSGKAYAPGGVVALNAQNNSAVLYAQWEENAKFDYEVIYNANFGETPETKADAENISGIYATAHTVGVDANSFRRSHYTFAGWNTAADGSGMAYAAGDTVELNAENNRKVLYAQWVENEKYAYTLIYNANFGASPETKADDQNVTGVYAIFYLMGVDENTFVRENYTFAGWNTEPDGSGKTYAVSGTLALTALDSTEVLYAQWIENAKYDYAVTYNANFGENPATATDAENVAGTYAVEHVIGVDANEFVRENYTFIGWATEPDGEVVYQAGNEIHFTQGGSEVLYAKWIEHDKYAYTVIYNGNGGALADGELAYGDAENAAETYAKAHEVTVDANTFGRENYTFTGWNTEADGSGTAYAAKDIIALTVEDNTETLYAQWEENPKYDHEIIYNNNDPEDPQEIPDEENKKDTYEDEADITVNENPFEKPGHEFDGWNTEPDGSGAHYDPEDVIHLDAEGDEPVVLYPQWKPVDVEVEVIYKVRVDNGEYVPFEGQLPKDATVVVVIPYGTELKEEVLVVPESISDEDYTYDYTAIEVLAEDAVVSQVVVYYSAVTPEPEVIIEIVDEPVPVVEEPKDEPEPVSSDELIEIPEEDVPLADAPKTGDPILMYAAMTVLSGLGLLGLNRKKKEEEE